MNVVFITGRKRRWHMEKLAWNFCKNVFIYVRLSFRLFPLVIFLSLIPAPFTQGLPWLLCTVSCFLAELHHLCSCSYGLRWCSPRMLSDSNTIPRNHVVLWLITAQIKWSAQSLLSQKRNILGVPHHFVFSNSTDLFCHESLMAMTSIFFSQVWSPVATSM